MNELRAMFPRILAMGLLALRNNTILPLLVNRDYDTQAKAKGETVDVPISAKRTVSDVVPSAIKDMRDSEQTDLTFRQIVLDKWKEATFFLTDKNVLSLIHI